MERFGAAHRSNAWSSPWTEYEPESEAQSHEVQSQSPEDFVHSSPGSQHACKIGPESAADHAGNKRSRQHQGGSSSRKGPQKTCSKNSPQNDLPLDTDIPEPRGKSQK